MQHVAFTVRCMLCNCMGRQFSAQAGKFGKLCLHDGRPGGGAKTTDQQLAVIWDFLPAQSIASGASNARKCELLDVEHEVGGASP